MPQLGALNYPSWSISAEAFFYLVFPWLGVFLWRRSAQASALIGTLWFIVSWAVLALGERWPKAAIVRHVMPVFELNLFVIGIVLGKVHFAAQQSRNRNQWLVHWGGVMGAVALLTLLAFTEWKQLLPFKSIHDALAAIIFLVLILAFASGNSVLHKVFTPISLVVLGESSYGLYLIHAPLYEFLIAAASIHRTFSSLVTWQLPSLSVSLAFTILRRRQGSAYSSFSPHVLAKR